MRGYYCRCRPHGQGPRNILTLSCRHLQKSFFCILYVGTRKKCTDLKLAKITHRAPPMQAQYSPLIAVSIHCWNPIFKGFILSHFGRVACVGHHGVLESTSTVGISTKCCGVPQKCPPKRSMSVTNLILTFYFTAMHRWNPLLKGFISSHFERVGCVVQHGVSIHTKVRKN